MIAQNVLQVWKNVAEGVTTTYTCPVNNKIGLESPMNIPQAVLSQLLEPLRLIPNIHQPAHSESRVVVDGLGGEVGAWTEGPTDKCREAWAGTVGAQTRTHHS